jgi:hypothetical protein
MRVKYNAITRKHFKIKDVTELLNDNRLYRLRSEDGLLDNDFIMTWNIVALPEYGYWSYLQNLPSVFKK